MNSIWSCSSPHPFTYLHQRTVIKRFIVVLSGCGFLNKNKSIFTFFLSVFPKLSTINFFICIKIFSLRDICQNDRNSNGSRAFFIQAKNVQSIKCRSGNRLPYKVYRALRNNMRVEGVLKLIHLSQWRHGNINSAQSSTLRKGVSAPRTATLPSEVGKHAHQTPGKKF